MYLKVDPSCQEKNVFVISARDCVEDGIHGEKVGITIRNQRRQE
jgi:hypothetical protein